MQLIASPIGTATKVFEQCFFRSAEFSSDQELRVVEVEPTKTGPIGTDGIGENKGIAPVIFRTRHTVTIPEAVEHTDLMLLGTPINPYKPIVWHRLIISLWTHDVFSRHRACFYDTP